MREIEKRNFIVIGSLLFLFGCASIQPVEEQAAMESKIKALAEVAQTQEIELQRLAEIVDTLEKKAEPVVEVKPAPKAKAQKKSERKSDDEINVLNHAEAMLNQNRSGEILPMLYEFLQRHSDHVYADRAQILIAACQYNLGQFDRAVDETKALESRYPYSLHLPAALQIRAASYEKLSQNAESQSTYRDLFNRYSEHPMIPEVREKLAIASTQRVDSSVPSTPNTAPPLMENESTP